MDIVEIVFEPGGGGPIIEGRRFNPGDYIRVVASVRSLGIPAAFFPVRFELYDGFPPFYTNTRTTGSGTAWVDWTLPDMVTKAIVRVTAFALIGGGATYKDIPIGIGTQPAEIKPPQSWLDKVLTYGLIGGGLVAGIWAASKILPKGAQKVRVVK